VAAGYVGGRLGRETRSQGEGRGRQGIRATAPPFRPANWKTIDRVRTERSYRDDRQMIYVHVTRPGRLPSAFLASRRSSARPVGQRWKRPDEGAARAVSQVVGSSSRQRPSNERRKRIKGSREAPRKADRWLGRGTYGRAESGRLLGADVEDGRRTLARIRLWDDGEG
jgi:hypothetical protein